MQRWTKHKKKWKITFIIVQDKCHSTYVSKTLETCDLITPKSACLDTGADADADTDLPYLLLYLEVGSAYKTNQIRCMKFMGNQVSEKEPETTECKEVDSSGRSQSQGNAKKRKPAMGSPAPPPGTRSSQRQREANQRKEKNESPAPAPAMGK